MLPEPSWQVHETGPAPELVFSEGCPRGTRGKPARADDRQKVHGLPLRWRASIASWEPLHRFVDEQIRGPYRMWCREHTFDSCDDSTLMKGRVEFAQTWGRLIERPLVRPNVEKIFWWRRARLDSRLGSIEARASAQNE